MLAEGLGIYKDTRLLCKLLLEYGRDVSKVVRFGIYERMTEKSARALDGSPVKVCGLGIDLH